MYVDDILLLENDVPMLNSVKLWLSKNFSMKDMGEATYILRIMIYRDRYKKIIVISQSKYINKILKRVSMEESKRGLCLMGHDLIFLARVRLDFDSKHMKHPV